MSVESQRRLIGGVREAVSRAKSGNRRGKPRRQSFEEVIEKLEREASAVQACVALALQLAGTDKLLPPEPLVPEPPPVGIGTATMHVTEPPSPRARPPLPERPRWTKDIRPGPHDVLTWEEAMQVPWYDPLAEGEG